MSNARIIVAICAAALLAACLVGRFTDAEGRLAAIKERFSGQKSYAILADHLYKVTKSAELADNTKAARSLLSEHPDGVQDVNQLVQAFGLLKDDSSGLESFCSKDNLANLRRVAEALRDGGNLGPERITIAILRLNKIVIRLIGDARKVCDLYLTEKWPKLWQPNFSDPAVKPRIERLYTVPNSFIYEGYERAYEPPTKYLPSSISNILERGEQDAHEPVHLDWPKSSSAEIMIATQLLKYVYEPCSEFVLLDEARELLVPFNDMLSSWFVISTRLLDQYYENKDAYRSFVGTYNFDTKVRDLAYSYQACQCLLATPKKNLAKMIRKYRSANNRS